MKAFLNNKLQLGKDGENPNSIEENEQIFPINQKLDYLIYECGKNLEKHLALLNTFWKNHLNNNAFPLFCV